MGRGPYACGEIVRPIRACTIRHSSGKREAQKTNKTVLAAELEAPTSA